MREPPHEHLSSLQPDPDGLATAPPSRPASGTARPRLFTSAARREVSTKFKAEASDERTDSPTPGDSRPGSRSPGRFGHRTPPGSAGAWSVTPDAIDAVIASQRALQMDEVYFRFLALRPYLEL